jgi:hypothetical protein
MSQARALHTATLLNDGRVLVTGGGTPNMSGGPLSGGTETPGPTPPPLNTAELYDPATGTWSSTGSMEAGLMFHTANLLQDGKVLVVGAESTGATSGRMVAQLYDPGSGTFSSTTAPTTLRALQTATTLRDGRVLIVGGVGGSSTDATSGSAPPLASAEIYDPGSATWSPAGQMTVGRVYHGSSILSDGRVLVVGGIDPAAGGTGLNTAEIYDPGSNTWSATGSTTSPTIGPTVTLLLDGKVLVAGLGDTSGMSGGSSGTTPDLLNTAELFDPATGTFSPVQVALVQASPGPSASLGLPF